MSLTAPSRTECMPSESNMRQLDVPGMTRPILENFDAHVNNLILFLRNRLGLHLVYQGPRDVHQHILQRSVYACSLYYQPKKILKEVYPIMIGSSLDMAVRQGMCTFKAPLNLLSFDGPFEELDLCRGFFIINGFVRQVPYFFTSDPTNTHVIQNKIVRVYSYNSMDRGKELSYHVGGEMLVVHNDGTTASNDPQFFAHCPYPVHLTAYMESIFREDLFDIDHLGNKVVVSPGHLFTKQLVKFLYKPLAEGNWKAIKFNATLVKNSIQNGFLLHVLSRKTVYFKEGKSAGKMTNEPQQSSREIGANGETFIEKNMGCYREISTQTYPLNPYLLYVIVRQMSKKVKHSSLKSFHDSYTGYLCILGCFETKNVGRTTMMVRETVVSTCDLLDPVFHDTPNREFWDMLDLEPGHSNYVVVNEACVAVSQKCFERVDLIRLKRRYAQIECQKRRNFIIIRFKPGLIMKLLPGTDIYVTPYDQGYWAQRLFKMSTPKKMVERWGFPFITSYLVDLNPWFNHTAFPKIILAFNALKNAVLATNRQHALYFMDSVSAYLASPDHEDVLAPADDGWSANFRMRMPRVNVTYMSYQGCTQEDCIVKRSGCRAFDCLRFYTIRFKLISKSYVKFYPARGDVDPESDLLGTLVSGAELEVTPFSIHARAVQKNPCEYRLYFTKFPFRVLQHTLMPDKLMVCIEQERVCSTADKLCSLHGQKGVIRVMEEVPEGLDLVINPYCLFRMTPGQILEGLSAGGKDIGGAFVGKTFYFPIAYWASEHLYAPENCVLDKVLGQAVKGRSRMGGMKLGNMELNALRANGIAACFEEKFFEDGDRITQVPTLALPKSVNLVQEDAKIYKCKFEFESSPSIELL